MPQWRDDPQRQAITVRHLATHTSGIEDAEADDLPHDRLTGWKGDFWKRLPPPHDPFTLARDVAPVLDVPGTNERYSNPGMAMLGYCVTASLRGTGDADLRSLLKHRIMEPLGVPDAEWSVGYGMTMTSGRPAPGGDLGRRLVQPGRRGQGRSAPAPQGRLGRAPDRLRPGRRGGHEAQRHAGPFGAGLVGEPGTGRNEAAGRPPPRMRSAGAGAGQQLLLVVPSLDLIVVRNGETAGPGALLRRKGWIGTSSARWCKAIRRAAKLPIHPAR